MGARWLNALPKPLAFALSGGANLGAVQVGMLQSLAQAGLEPDLVVGTSVGALNGVVVADRGLKSGLEVLRDLWHNLNRHDIFPGGVFAQARHLLMSRVSLFPANTLTELICQTLSVNQFGQLQIPFGAMATELLTHHGTLFTQGDIHAAVLASTAIPGIYPPVTINDKLYIDGAFTAHVPLRPAVTMGAASLVVLDAGNTCRHMQPPRHVAEVMLATVSVVLRQRVLVEAPLIAAEIPVLYLPTPCTRSISFFDFKHTADLIDQAAELTEAFLQTAAIPQRQRMSGNPHFHDTALAENISVAVAA